MKKINKILILSIMFLLVFTSLSFADETEYTLKREFVFKNQKKYELTTGFVEIFIGSFNFTQYQEDVAVRITPNPDELREDEYGNKYAYYSLEGMMPGAELKVIIERDVIPGVVEPEISVRSNVTVTEELKKFIEPQERVESDDAKIIAKAKELTDDISSDYKKALAIFEFVNTQLQYDTGEAYANKGALSALENKRGVCEEFASLYVALCRSVNIPARVIEGYKIDKKDVEQENGEYLTEYNLINHVWAEIYLDDHGWLPVEPTIIYMVGNERVPYTNAFCKIELPEYMPTGIYDYTKADRTMLRVTEISYDDELFPITYNESTINFTDVDEGYEWARESIQNLYELGVVNGYGEFEYGPGRNISRIEFMCMLSRTLKYMNQSSVNEGLVYYHMDYDKEHWSKEDYDFLMRCYQAITPSDIVSAGYYNLANVFGSSLDMDRPIKRDEVVALMDVFMKLPVGDNIFTDIDNSNFKNSILKSYANGLITGYTDGTFRPDAEITRAEMAAVLNRYIAQNTYVLTFENEV